MTSATATIKSERAGSTVLKVSYSNLDGDQSNDIVLPTGFGDCALDWMYFEWNTFATPAASLATFGVSAQIVDGSLVDVRDMLGVSPILLSGAEQMIAFVQRPQGAALWRANERVLFTHQELDTNAAPTVDLGIAIGVRRISTP